jgi:hypothetical protein
VLDEANELAEPLIELADQEAMKPTLFSSGEKNVVRSIMAALRQTDASVNRTLPICHRRTPIALLDNSPSRSGTTASFRDAAAMAGGFSGGKLVNDPGNAWR